MYRRSKNRKAFNFERLEERHLFAALIGGLPHPGTTAPLDGAAPTQQIQQLKQPIDQVFEASEPVLKNGTLTINAVAGVDSYLLRTEGQILILETVNDHVPKEFRYLRNQVQRVSFNGSSLGDHFINQTDIPSNIYGNGGDDTLIGGSAVDRIVGGQGDDIIYGKAGSDYLYGDWFGFAAMVGTGADTIYGGDHDDTIFGGGGSNTMYGESGYDTITGSDGNDTIYGGIEDDVLVGKGGNDEIYGEAGVDELRGGTGDDILDGGAGDDTLEGGFGNDTYVFNVDHSQGLDTVKEKRTYFAFHDRDTLEFKAEVMGVQIDLSTNGNQQVNENLSLLLENPNAIENVIGTNARDVIFGNKYGNVLEGRGGNDDLIGLGGQDRYVLNADEALGNDAITDWHGDNNVLDFSSTQESVVQIDLRKQVQQVNENLSFRLLSGITDVIGGQADDVLTGNEFDNHLMGGKGNDILIGRVGEDKLEGQAGDDILKGGEGYDRYLFVGSQLGSDVIEDSSKQNRLDFSSFNGAVSVDLSNNDHQIVNRNNLNLRIRPGSQVTDVSGSRYSDIIIGNELDNTLVGNSGGDFIFGREGNDRLLGGAGNDWLLGEGGNDGLYGGSEQETDLLIGGGDEDRLLTMKNDLLLDLSRNDAEIRFTNDSSTWTEREVEQVDLAFEQMQDAAGSVAILKDRWTQDPLQFVKVKWNGEWGGRNSTSWWLWNKNRKIQMVDWNELDPDESSYAKSTVIHEIAHNWDDNRGEKNPYWNVWEQLNERSQSLNDFAREYGTKNVQEDWATTWEHYFNPTMEDRSDLFKSKLDIVDRFFDNFKFLYSDFV